MSRISLKTALLATAPACLLGCAAPSDVSSTSAEVSFSANPNPASAQPSSGVFYILQGNSTTPDQTLQYPFQTAFTVTMNETGGEALEITSISLKVQQASGGIITPPTNGQVEHYQFLSSASGSHIAAKGQAEVGFQVWFALPSQGRECVATISVSFVDQKGTADDTSDDVGFAKTFTVQIQ